MSENNFRRKSLVWPLVLISIGVVFLLNNLGIVSWNVWALLWRMWPVLVVAIGLDLIFGRRSGIWAAITVVMVIVLFAGAFWLFNVTGDAWGGEQVSQAINQELGKAETAEVTIRMSVGEMIIDSQSEETGMLIEGDILVGEFEDVREQYDLKGDVAVYSLSTHGQQYHPGWLFSNSADQDKSWDLLLNPDVETDLNVDTGVGRTQLNLTDMLLSDLDVDSGVGEVVIYLPEEGDFDANINGGVGQITVYIPEGVSVRIRVDNGLGNLDLDGNFSYENGAYYSGDIQDGDPMIDLFVDGGVGNIRIVQEGF